VSLLANRLMASRTGANGGDIVGRHQFIDYSPWWASLALLGGGNRSRGYFLSGRRDSMSPMLKQLGSFVMNAAGSVWPAESKGGRCTAARS
jgi:hypothetical protein